MENGSSLTPEAPFFPVTKNFKTTKMLNMTA